jgi:hypothetical protein
VVAPDVVQQDKPGQVEEVLALPTDARLSERKFTHLPPTVDLAP